MPRFVMDFAHIAIIGPGLLGGSIALALRERFHEVRISLWARRAEAVAESEARNIAHQASTNLAEVVCGADLVIFCTPIGVMPALAAQMLPHLAPNALVTDVGSVKARAVEELAPILGGRFVGSHPMAGSDQAGLHAARPGLFEDAVCILTPTPAQPVEPVERVAAFWRGLGSRVHFLSPEKHDETVAVISHFPHLLAAALVEMVCSQNADALPYCGSGFRDTTRVAAGPAAMWAEILESNRPAVRNSIRSMIKQLTRVDALLDDPDALRDFLVRAKAGRDALRLPLRP